MSKLVAHEIQAAVYDILVADPSLQTRLAGIYDQAPTDASFPYLVMGDSRISDAGVKDRGGSMVSFDLMVWSDMAGQMEVKELISLVHDVMTGASIAIAGHSLTLVRLEQAATSRDFSAAGGLHRGQLSYQALVFAEVS